MLEMHPARPEELPRLKEAWSLAFGDDIPFIDRFFTRFCPQSGALALLEDGRPAAMLVLLPLTLAAPGQPPVSAAYVYALCTHPDHRGRGLAHQLLHYADYFAHARGCDYICTVPAEPSLHQFFASAGYAEAFTTRTLDLKGPDLPAAPPRTALEPLSPAEYGRLRERLLSHIPHLAYPTTLLDFQRDLSQSTGADLYRLTLDEAEGCAAVERTGEELLVKELLLPPQALAAGPAALAAALPAPRSQFRGPALPGGQAWAFGMGKPLDGRPHPLDDAYLGLAFD